MQIQQLVINNTQNIAQQPWPRLQQIAPQLVLVFAADCYFESELLLTLLEYLPNAQWVGCSTAGEISTNGVTDNSIVITAIHFDHPDFRVVHSQLTQMEQSVIAGQHLAKQLICQPDLKHILVFGQGVNINGSALIQGITQDIPQGVTISGGLAGDGGKFVRTFILNNKGISETDLIAIGFYGWYLSVVSSSFGGWKGFGAIRKITRYQGNILYELDGKPALELYKRYLGDYAADLPASGLLFPFSLLSAEGSEVGIIRTILGIDETQGSLILAGDLADDGYLQLMHASTDALVDGAQTAAEMILQQDTCAPNSLALLVSCVGRKLLMGGRAEEEVDAVANVLSKQTTITGFYSNGEISPMSNSTECALHNQTMTITFLSEKC